MISILLSALGGALLCFVLLCVYIWARFALPDPWCPIACILLLLLWGYMTGNFVISLFSY